MQLTSKKIGTLIILLFGTFLSFLNQTLMNVALPKIMSDFHISAAQGQWLSNGYLLVNGIMIPLTAFLIDRFKTRPLYLTAISLFTLGTAIAGFSSSYSWLIIGRMVQATGAGIVAPLLTVVVMNLFPLNKRGQAMGYIGLAMNFAPAIGPTLSGWVVQNFDWHNLFLMILPLAVLNIIIALILLENLGEHSKPKLHLPSIVLSTIGLGSLLLGFSNAGEGNWLSFPVIGYILIGSITLFIFVYTQNRLENPLLNFSVFHSKQFSIATISNFFVIMGLYGGMLLLPLFVQNVQGISPFKSGLIMLPGALVMASCSPIAGSLYDRFGAKYLSFIGIIILTFGTFLFSLITMNTSLIYIASVQTVRSLGLALVLMPLQTEALNSLPHSLISHGSAMYNTIRQIAGSIGTAALITIMTLAAKNYHTTSALPSAELAKVSLIHGIKTAYIITTTLSVIAALLTLLFPTNKKTRKKPSLASVKDY